MTRRDRCQTCYFWDLPHPDDPGMCHRFPQSVEKRPLDWCGEWKQSAEDAAAVLQAAREAA